MIGSAGVHELSMCEGIVQLLQERARVEQFSRVQCIRLEIGKLSCVESGALRFAFDAVTRGSVAEHARLEIDQIAGSGWCQQCGREVEIEQRFDACPVCESCPLDIRAGEEMRIKYIEVI